MSEHVEKSYWFAAENGHYVIGDGDFEVAYTKGMDRFAELFARRVVALLRLHVREEITDIEAKVQERGL